MSSTVELENDSSLMSSYNVLCVEGNASKQEYFLQDTHRSLGEKSVSIYYHIFCLVT